MAVFRSFRNPWWFSSLLLPVLLLLLWPAPTIQQDADDPVLDLKLATYPTSINASWNSIKGATNYNITWIDTGSQNTECLVTTSDNTYTLDNLQPCTQYTVTVEAWNTTDLLVDEENVTRTLPEAPSAVSNLVVTQIDFEPELKVSWSSVEHNGTCILEYKVTWLDLNDTTTDSLDTVWLDEMKEHQYDRNEDSPYVFWMNGMDEYDDNFKSSYRTEYDFIEMVDNYNDTTNDTNYTITGLNYGDVYNVCVVASAEDEEADPSCKEELVEPPIYVTVTATPDGSYKINVGWTLDSNVTTQVKAYYMSWHAGNAGHTYINDATITSCTITGLVPCTYYTVVMQPFDAAGDDGNHVGGPGNDSTTTGTEAPYNVAVTMVTDQSDHLSVTWTPAQSSDRCNVASNIVSWWRDNSNDTADRIELSPTTEAYTITGLEPWTTYIVCVKAAHLSLEGGMACDTGTTDEDIPEDAVKNLRVSGNATGDTIPLTWCPPDTPNGDITYSITWIPNDSSDSHVTSGTTNPINQISLSTRDSNSNDTTKDTKYTILDLKACTSYTITVTPTTSKGSGPKETIISDTLYIAPEPPTDLLVDMVYNVSQSLSVNWTQAVVIPNCDLTNNTVSWSVNNTGDDEACEDIDPIYTSFTITDLNPWTTYSVCVASTNQVGTSVTSPCKLQTTDEDTPGPPINTSAEPESSSSIIVSWEPPIIPNGILTRYTVRWTPDSNDGTDGHHSLDNTTLSYIVTNLTACTLYSTSVLPATSKGDTTTPGVVQNSTETEDPPPPGSVNCQSPEAHMLKVEWTDSTSVCPVVRYLVRYEGQVLWSNYTDSGNTTTTVTNVNLAELIAWTNYYVCVQAQICDGKVSEKKCCMETTTEAAPGEPGSLNKTGSDTNSISFTWTQPDHLNGNLTGYQITWGSSRKNITDPKETSTKISGLKAGTMYKIEVQGMTAGGIGTAKVEDMSTIESSNTGVIIGAVVGSLLLLVLLVLAFAYRNKIREVTSKQGKSSSKPVHSASHNGAARPSVPPRPAHISLAPISKFNWKDGEVGKHEIRPYIQHLEENTQHGLEEEFMKVRELSPQHPSHAATRDFNKPKNRWVNILPFDHSRVKLPLLPNQSGSDYINANYILDANDKYHFIATQGPKDNTVDDLWRMVWELKVYTVIMLTNIKESGKNKCAQYWPLRTDPPLNTGTFTVINKEEENNTDYSLRYLMLHVGDQKRLVKQYHFTAWPDFSAPEHEHQLLDFVKTVRDGTMKESKVIVHCSAGVGRTGTFIGLWNLINILERESSAANVNVRKTVVAMRECRTTMIQSQEQLLYLWKCVAAYLDTPDKWRPYDAYGSYDNPAYTEPIYDNI